MAQSAPHALQVFFLTHQVLLHDPSVSSMISESIHDPLGSTQVLLMTHQVSPIAPMSSQLMGDPHDL